jgi:hypothetical protein
MRGIFAHSSAQQARERLGEVVERLEPTAPKVVDAAGIADCRGSPYLRFTVRVTGMLCEIPPPEPVTVIVLVPVGVPRVVVTVRRVLADEPSVTVAGSNVADEDAGRPAVVNDSVPLNELSDVAVIV